MIYFNKVSGGGERGKWEHTPLSASLGGETTHFAVNYNRVFKQTFIPKYA